jgi:hypothetical protein
MDASGNPLPLDIDAQSMAQIMGCPKLWAEAFLLTPTTNAAFEANYIQELILTSKRRFNVIRVHRRGGKSYAFAVLALYYALTIEACEILVIGPAGNHVENIFNTLREFVRVNEWIAPHKIGDKQSPQQLKFDNGSRITGLTTGARSKGKGMGIRGQGADIILVDEAAYLDEGDWPSLIPIMKGDENRRFPPRVYIASTPAHTRGYYYEFCTNPRMKKAWHEIHVSIEKNERLLKEKPEFIEEARALCPSELDWQKEYLAEFPEMGEGVFPKSMVEKAAKDFTYEDHRTAVVRQNQTQQDPATRTMGVDWDKYNKDGHGPNIVILEATHDNRYRVILREEIKQSEFTLGNAVNRIIELDMIYQCTWIFVDRGYGEYQLEELQKRGLAKKVVGHTFVDSIECPLPGGGMEKKRFKQAMISVLRGWFERGIIELSKSDPALIKQLIEYRVVGKTDSTLKFSDENEHGIDAMGLAAMAMFTRVKNPYAPKPCNNQIYRHELPIAVDSKLLRGYQRNQDGLISGRPWYDPLEAAPDNTFSRKVLGRHVPGRRKSF